MILVLMGVVVGLLTYLLDGWVGGACALIGYFGYAISDWYYSRQRDARVERDVERLSRRLQAVEACTFPDVPFPEEEPSGHCNNQ